MSAFGFLSRMRPVFFSYWPLHLRMAAQMSYGEINHSFHIMPELGILYVSIPKVACTSLKLTFNNLYGGNPDIRPGQIHNVENQPWQHVTDSGLRDLARRIESGELRPVTFVRNPFSRALSCYRNQFEFPLRNWEKTNRVHLRSLLLDDPMRPATFLEFLAAVGRKKSVDMNGHWRPQADFVMAKDIPYSFIGHQETLGDDLKELGRMIGKDFSSLRVPSKNRTGAGTMLGDYYTPEAIDLVRHIYATDFEIFGYSKDLPEQGISAPLASGAARKQQKTRETAMSGAES